MDRGVEGKSMTGGKLSLTRVANTDSDDECNANSRCHNSGSGNWKMETLKVETGGEVGDSRLKLESNGH